MPVAQVNGIRLYFEVGGDGPPLLLISGLGQNSGVWTPVLPAFRRSFRCITFDNRGTGRSDVPPGPYAIDRMADDAAALLDHLGLASAAVVGWSLGGSVAQSLLIRHSERIERAVLLNAFPCYTAVQHGWLDALIALRRSGAAPVAQAVFGMAWGLTPLLLSDHAAVLAAAEASLRDPHPTGNEGFEAQAEGLRRYDSRPDLPKVTRPTLVLAGAEDILTPLSQSIEIASLIPGAELKVLGRGGHRMIVEYSADVVREITAFVLRT